MLQDKNGVLWMAGGDGIARYDGCNTTSFRHNNADSTTISGNSVLAFYEDSKGRLWYSSFSGLDVSDFSKTRFYNIPFSDPSSIARPLIRTITEDSLGHIWVATDSLVLKLEEQDRTFVHRTVHEFLKEITICDELQRPTALFTDTEGRIWIGTETGLCIYDDRQKKMLCPSDISGLPQRPIQDIGYDRLGRIWISCANEGTRLFYSDPGKLNFLPFDKLPFEDASQSLQFAFDLDNRLWASVFSDQVYGYDFRDSTVFLRSNVNSNVPHERFLRNPVVDHSGNVWLHGQGYQIYRYPKGFRNYLHPFAFHQSNTDIYGTGDTLWFAYREEGLVRVLAKTGETILLSTKTGPHPRLSGNHIIEMFRARSGHFILVGFGHINIMSSDGGIIHRHRISGTNRAGFEDSKGRIWIGGFSGLHLLDEEKGILASYQLNLKVNDSRQFIQAIVEDSKGQIWFSSGLHGLAVLNPETGTIRQFFPVPGDIHSLPSGAIADMAIKDDILWLATDVALVRVDPSTMQITSYNRAHGFTNDFISAVLCGHDGQIWVSTNSGISAFDPKTELATNYSVADGLLNRSYYLASSYQSPDGMIYFGGENGVDIFNPAHLRKNPTAPRMHLAGITVDNKATFSSDDIACSGALNLTYKDDHIDIEFFGLHYAEQEKVRNFYKLDGMHEEWIDIGSQRNVVFSDLAPGDYVFRAKASSADGVGTEEELVIPIRIVPPFYATLWFRILGCIAAAAILFGYIKFRERTIQQKERQDAEVARKITELEKRALQAQMNPHFIYNCMNSIQQFMILHDFEGAMKYLTRFSRLLRSVLNMSAQSRIVLSDEIKLIEDYLELENMRFPNKFVYRIEVSPEVNIHTVEIPPFFIQPQVENAVRHGLINKSSQGRLLIKIDKADQLIKVLVEDNGIGRVIAQANKSNDNVIHESKGLTIVKERLAHLHSENGLYPFEIIDLYDPQGKATGTRVEITLPIE